LNPVLIVILTPVFNSLWELLKRRRGGVEVPDTRKMLLGFFIVIGCMALMSAIGFATGSGRVTVWWLCLATFVITLSELCISVVGLEFAFKVAAPGTKSVVTAAFLFTVFAGDFVGGFFDKGLWGKVSAGVFFGIQTVIMIVTAGLFVIVARRFEQPEDASARLPATAS
jgi:dipeptide/tripeptide permease